MPHIHTYISMKHINKMAYWYKVHHIKNENDAQYI